MHSTDHIYYYYYYFDQTDIKEEEIRLPTSTTAMATCLWISLLLMSFPSTLLAADEDFPGWMGERRIEMKTSEQDVASSFTVDPTKVISLSWKPRVFLYKGFLTEEECDHLISLAKSGLQKSAVVDNDSGKPILSEIRTSSGMFIEKDKDEVVSRIENKIALWTFLGKENGERIQILKYEKGEKYEPHYDYFQDKINQVQGGHRIATVLMYLTDVVKGGETVFPEAKRDRHFVKDDTLSDCAKRGIAVKPRRGDALLFFSLYPTAIPDPSSLHAGCPVIEGEKWSATKWIHMQSFDAPRKDIGDCRDENESCGEWAAYGECQKNAVYMIGTPEKPGSCRRSCRVC